LRFVTCWCGGGEPKVGNIGDFLLATWTFLWQAGEEVPFNAMLHDLPGYSGRQLRKWGSFARKGGLDLRPMRAMPDKPAKVALGE
jgi:hypothetical protein